MAFSGFEALAVTRQRAGTRIAAALTYPFDETP